MSNLHQEIQQNLTSLKLSMFLENYQAIAERFEKEQRSHSEFLHELLLREAQYRHQKRIEKLVNAAKLPRNKLLSDFDIARIPSLAPSQITKLAEGDFIDRYDNVLIFGNPGTGKTHLSIALAREWCLLGRKVKFFTAANLVQLLLQANAQLKLTKLIKQLDRYEVLIIDDISYIPFDKNEANLLFKLLADRYEMRSIMITSNLPFSKWNTIFHDEMTTNAAVDRLVHHSTILELNAPSYRAERAKNKLAENSQKSNKCKGKKEVLIS